MEWRPSMVLKEAEANQVLTKLRWTGVNVKLEGEDRNKAIKVIESFLKRYKKCCWPVLMIEITGAIRRQLLKSRNVIDVDMVTQVVDYLSNGCVVKKKNKDGSSSDEETDSDEEKEYNWKDEPDRYLGSDEEEEDSGFEDDSEEDEATLKKMAEAAAAAEAEEKQEIQYLHERKKKYIEDLRSLSEKKGLSLKKGDEEKIFEMMIPYILGSRGYYDDSMEIFLSSVREHIDRCSSLDDVDTIKTALESKDFFSFEDDHWKIIEQNDSNTTREEEKEEDMADAKDQVNHSLNKTVVPTKEEGVTTPMHQIKQGENGDIMEFEEQETLSPLNLPKPGKEGAASAHSSIKESLDRAAANKRKLAQIQPGLVCLSYRGFQSLVCNSLE